MPHEDRLNRLIIYVSNAKMAMTEEEALLVFYSGGQVFQFVFSPKHIKRLNIFLEKHLAAWEKKHGRIKTELSKSEKETREKEAIGFRIVKGKEA